MKTLSLIACVSKDYGLGKANDLLWKIPEDQKFFRELTVGHPVVMGGKTFRSIGRALPKRENIVLSRHAIEAPGVKWVESLVELNSYLDRLDQEIFIIGGATLYQEYIDQADRIILTEVDAIKPAEVYFPKFDQNEFEARQLGSGEFEGVKYRMVEYRRKQAKSCQN